MFRLAAAFILLLFYTAGLQASQNLDRLTLAGAHQLALHKIELELGEVQVGSGQWLQLKREQVEVLNKKGDYPKLAQLLPQDIQQSQDLSTRRWLQNQLIQALINAGQAPQALAVIDAAIAENQAINDSQAQQAIVHWRRKRVEAFVLAERYDEATDALVSYENDYQIQSDASSLKPGIQRWPWPYSPRFNQELTRSKARLFLEAGHVDMAADLLREDSNESVQLIRLLALLNTQLMPAKQVYQQAVSLASSGVLNLSQRKSAWVLAAEAASYAQLPEEHVRAIKKSMALAIDLPFAEPLLAYTAEASWLRLMVLGKSLLPEQATVEGLVAAAKARTQPLERLQAQFIALAQQLDSTQARSELYIALITSEPDSNVRQQLMPMWLLNNETVDTQGFSESLRYELTELLLANGDIPQAAKLMAGLHKAPSGVSEPEWQLRRARVLILAAKPERGVPILHRLAKGDFAGKPDINRFLQAVFDVQAVGANQAAIALFQRLLEGDLSARQTREIHYWLADAASAGGQPELAAEHYLLSAGEGAGTWDSWGIGARRRAADSLTKAGMHDDAINLYQRLLDRSEDRTERAVLRTKIQRLRAKI